MPGKKKIIKYYGGPFDGQSHSAYRLYHIITRHIIEEGDVMYYDYEHRDGNNYYFVNAYSKTSSGSSNG